MIKYSLLKHLFCKCAALWKQVEQSSLAFLPRSAISCVSQQGPLTAENTPPLPPPLQQGFPVEEGTKSNSPHFLFSPSCGFNVPDAALLFSGRFRCLSRSCTEHSLLPLHLDWDAGLSLMKVTHRICVSDHNLHQILGFKCWAQPCTTSQRATHHCFCRGWSHALPPASFSPSTSSSPQEGPSWPAGCVLLWKQHLSKPIAYTCLNTPHFAYLGQEGWGGSKAQKKYTSYICLTSLRGDSRQVSSQVCQLSAPVWGVAWGSPNQGHLSFPKDRMTTKSPPGTPGVKQPQVCHPHKQLTLPPVSPSTLAFPHESHQEWKQPLQYLQPCCVRIFCSIQLSYLPE